MTDVGEKAVRVLHVVNDLSGGGAERLVLDLCRYATSEVHCRVATVLSGGSLMEQYSSAGVKVLCAGRRRGRPGIRAARRLIHWSQEADVVHTHLWGGEFWGGISARMAGKPVVTTVHNTRGDGRIRDTLLSLFGPRDACHVGVSPACVEFSMKGGRSGDRRVIFNGVDLSRFRVSPVIRGVPWQLLFVGRLTRQKGVDLLLKALRGVPDVELHLVGDGEEREALQRLAGEQGVSVKFHGWVPDVTVFYEACHLVVLPSRWEGFGLVAVEAMASGRPVLGSSVDGLDDVLGSVGFRSVAGDVFSLRAAIVDALQDPSSLVRKGAAGPARAARYDIRQTVGAYERLYRELL